MVPESQQKLGLFPGNYITYTHSLPPVPPTAPTQTEDHDEYSDPKIDVSSYVEYAKAVFADKEQLSIDQKFREMVKSKSLTGP